METGPEQLKNHYMIREDSTICGDTINLIAYPSFLLITWNISKTTRFLIEDLLEENYDDLYIRINLYRNRRRQKLEFPINSVNGVLRIKQLRTGSYSCDTVVSNSQNETITINGVEEFQYCQDKEKIDYYWSDVTTISESWTSWFSGYTVYE